MMSGKGTLHNSRPVYNQMSAKPICKGEAIIITILCYKYCMCTNKAQGCRHFTEIWTTLDDLLIN